MNSPNLQPNHRILILADSRSIHADFRNILCPKNSDEAAADQISFELDTARQGQVGLEMVKQALAKHLPYALAFVDVRLPPGPETVETVARIWQVDPEIQIVVCTGYENRPWRDMPAKVGQSDNLLVLKKPFDKIEIQQLALVLTRKWLLSRQAETQIAELARDVSERAALERQLRQAQKMDAIGQLAAGVAHDFSNILTVIQGHATLMQQKLDSGSPQAKSSSEKSLEQITRAAARAATLIRQLLMFSRKQVMQFRHLDLNDTLRSAIKMLERLVGEHMQIDFHPQLRIPAIHADSSMVEQIAMNLTVNARDAMPNGGQISIATSLETIRRGPIPMDPECRDGDYVCLRFSDTGTGMDTQILSRIFEPFFTTKPVGKGTGLGLSTVFGIVRQHQGWLEVESELNKGSVFRVYFPASRKAAEKTEPVVDTSLRKGRETVLVAEDEAILREMVVQVLKAQGYTVLEATSGRHALEVWERANRPIDLLLTDMVMPEGIMGPDLAERLSSQCPHLKVIYTSGYSPGIAGKDVSLLEGQNFLPKPFSIGKLAQFVRACLDAPLKRK